jgi:hypothetical protein
VGDFIFRSSALLLGGLRRVPAPEAELARRGVSVVRLLFSGKILSTRVEMEMKPSPRVSKASKSFIRDREGIDASKYFKALKHNQSYLAK